MASLSSASSYRTERIGTYGPGHGEPRFEGDGRHGPFGALAHEAFGFPGTGDVGWEGVPGILGRAMTVTRCHVLGTHGTPSPAQTRGDCPSGAPWLSGLSSSPPNPTKPMVPSVSLLSPEPLCLQLPLPRPLAVPW